MSGFPKSVDSRFGSVAVEQVAMATDRKWTNHFDPVHYWFLLMADDVLAANLLVHFGKCQDSNSVDVCFVLDDFALLALTDP